MIMLLYLYVFHTACFVRKLLDVILIKVSLAIFFSFFLHIPNTFHAYARHVRHRTIEEHPHNDTWRDSSERRVKRGGFPRDRCSPNDDTMTQLHEKRKKKKKKDQRWPARQHPANRLRYPSRIASVNEKRGGERHLANIAWHPLGIPVTGSLPSPLSCIRTKCKW